jgi:hypothetical protein
MMIKAIALLYPKGANVRIPFEVGFYEGFDKDNPDDAHLIDDIVQQMFPHLEGSAFGEFIEEKTND